MDRPLFPIKEEKGGDNVAPLFPSALDQGGSRYPAPLFPMTDDNVQSTEYTSLFPIVRSFPTEASRGVQDFEKQVFSSFKMPPPPPPKDEKPPPPPLVDATPPHLPEGPAPKRRRAMDFFKDEEEEEAQPKPLRVDSSSRKRERSESPPARRRREKEKERQKEKKEKKKEKDPKHKRKKKEKEKKEKKKKKDKDRKKKKEKKREKSPKLSKEKELEIERRLARDDTRTHTMKWVTDINKEVPVQDMYQWSVNGDRNNLLFGYLYRLDIPHYKRQRFCLGLPPNERLTFTQSLGYISLTQNSNSTAHISRYCKGKNIVIDDDVPGRHKKRVKEDTEKHDEFEEGIDFVELPSDDEADIKEEGEEESEEEDPLYKKTKHFNVRTRENPKDVALWIDFINFQDEFGSATDAPIIEKKLAIYRKALQENPDSIDLLLGYLKTSGSVLEGEKMVGLWENALDTVPEGVELWREYIAYRLATFSVFSISSMREVFTSAIQSLRRLEAEKLPNKEEAMLSFFLQAVSFEKKAGYIEKAVSMFQALLEFNCFYPSQLTTHTAQIKKFELFWESDAPRIGETGSKGWAKWMEDELAGRNTKPSGEEETKASDDMEMNDTLEGDPSLTPQERCSKEFATWIEREDKLDRTAWLPCRSGEGVKDPESVILFEDIKYYMFRMGSEQLKTELFFHFLQFLGVSLKPGWCKDVTRAQLLSWERAESLEEVPFLIGNFSLPLPGKNCHNAAPIQNMAVLKFIRGIFSQGLVAFPHCIDLAASYIQFESTQGDASLSRSLAKSLLKTKSQSLPLWNQYALMEYSANNMAEARKVYDTALSANLPGNSREDQPLLYRYYSEMEFYHPYRQILANRGNSENEGKVKLEDAQSEEIKTYSHALALHVLISFVEKSFKRHTNATTPPVIAPTRVVKARSLYKQRIDEEVSAGSGLALKHVIVCYALFEYLTSGFEAASTLYGSFLQPRHPLLSVADGEELWESHARLLYTHSEQHTTPPSKTRPIIMAGLESYPANPLLLSLFVEGESRSKIENRLRRHFDTSLQHEPHPIIWLFAIHCETDRLGSAHRVRALFERALQKNSTSKNVVVLWRYYLQWETQQGNADAAYRIYIRAINQVPSSKSLWLDIMRHLLGAIPPKDITRNLNLMLEKEIRLRGPLDSLQLSLDALEPPASSDSDSED